MTDTTQTMLGRQAERQVIDRLLEQALAGRSGVLVLRGEAGVGKSTLLDYALSRARSLAGDAGDVASGDGARGDPGAGSPGTPTRGLRVIRTQGYESESEIPFAGISDLLRPLLPWLDALPRPQAAALRGAMAIAPASGGDRFTVCAATLSLLAAAAEEQPLLALVDDAQWVDAASLEALLFAARRLEAEGVALLMAVRPESDTNVFGGIPTLEVRGLDPEDARALVARSAPTLSDAAFERLYEQTGGNPMALRELPALLGDPQRRLGLPHEGPLPAGSALEEALHKRLSRLPADTQRALVFAAATPTTNFAVVLEALRRHGLDVDAFEPAEREGIVRFAGSEMAFGHPLLRSVSYHRAPLADRVDAHRALAEATVLLPPDEAADARAWHLAAATLTPDESVAAELEAAGMRARNRRAYAAAARCLERAATITPVGTDRARRLLKAAKWWQMAGLVGRAGKLLVEALRYEPPPIMRAEIQHLRGYVQMWRSAPPTAGRLLVDEAARVEALDPGRAALMLADAAIPGFMTGELARALELAERASEVASRSSTTPRLVAAVVLAVALTAQRRRAEALQLLEAWTASLHTVPPLARAQEILLAAMTEIWLERYDEAGRLLDRLFAAAQSAGALGILPYTLAERSELGFRTGSWDQAYADASESIRLAAETSQANAYSLYFAAHIEAARGQEEECRSHARAALDVAAKNGIGCMPTYTGSVLGLLELGLGRTEEAIAELEKVAALAERQQLRDPTLVQWAPDLVEAYVMVGRVEDARRVLERLRPESDDGEAWAHAATARCEGLIAEGDEAIERFEQALEWHERDAQPFERARTQLCLGERLRRSRSRARAREWLERALETFEDLGAAPWAARAHRELSATGPTARRRDPSTAGQLTPQELQVALTVAAGLTNAE
ncbi:MAG TPA: AAA family ATPase, partial [Egibacteraceae bacterium]